MGRGFAIAGILTLSVAAFTQTARADDLRTLIVHCPNDSVVSVDGQQVVTPGTARQLVLRNRLNQLCRVRIQANHQGREVVMNREFPVHFAQTTYVVAFDPEVARESKSNVSPTSAASHAGITKCESCPQRADEPGSLCDVLKRAFADIEAYRKTRNEKDATWRALNRRLREHRSQVEAIDRELRDINREGLRHLQNHLTDGQNAYENAAEHSARMRAHLDAVCAATEEGQADDIDNARAQGELLIALAEQKQARASRDNAQQLFDTVRAREVTLEQIKLEIRKAELARRAVEVQAAEADRKLKRLENRVREVRRKLLEVPVFGAAKPKSDHEATAAYQATTPSPQKVKTDSKADPTDPTADSEEVDASVQANGDDSDA